MRGDIITIGFSVYKFDYEFYKNLKKTGRVRHGETSMFMRQQFRKFCETHARNYATKSDPELPVNSLTHQQQEGQLTDETSLFKTNNTTKEVQQQGGDIC